MSGGSAHLNVKPMDLRLGDVVVIDGWKYDGDVIVVVKPEVTPEGIAVVFENGGKRFTSRFEDDRLIRVHRGSDALSKLGQDPAPKPKRPPKTRGAKEAAMRAAREEQLREAESAHGGSVVTVKDNDDEYVVVMVRNGGVQVQQRGTTDLAFLIDRTDITSVRQEDAETTAQMSRYLKSLRPTNGTDDQADEAEEGADMAQTATATKKTTAKKSPAKKATTAKAPAKATSEVAERLQPSAEMKKQGVVRITGRSAAKQKVNFAIVEAVVVKGTDVDAVSKKQNISAKQINRIVGLAKGEIDPDRKL